ncbi:MULTISPECIES: hypothetical protein [Streptomyces]|uniref:hypothetical protein n=1 Tax=Streptomyces TaxID=1883 RepID=UPI000D67A62E|nr:hypothetical protein [Streptomyces sp. NWU49]PWJ04481.1 hypothetical protein DKG34_28320 [Streptomyces sp. NWU49]
MRLSRLIPTAAAVAFVFVLPYEAVAHARAYLAEAQSDDPFGAACRVRVDGSQVTAYCHNPYPDTDHVSLHVECVHWWDLDSDGAPVAAGPAQTVQLTGRCWKEVRTAWVTHRRAD